MSVNFRLNATKIIGQMKAFYRQGIPESNCARKETVDINILVTSRNDEIYQNNKQTYLEKKKVKPAEPVLKNIYQSNTNRKDFSWPHFDDESRIQEKQQVKCQKSCISVFVACLTNPSSN